MQGILFLLSIVGVGVIGWWMIKNDQVSPEGQTTGLLAMQDTPPAPPPKPGLVRDRAPVRRR